MLGRPTDILTKTSQSKSAIEISYLRRFGKERNYTDVITEYQEIIAGKR